MKTVSKQNCAILPLVLKGRWYDMIDSGEKTEEYREMKDFWVKRIARWATRCMDEDKTPIIAFSRGYRKPSMFFLCGSFCDRYVSMHKDWGEPETQHFVLKLAERVEIA